MRRNQLIRFAGACLGMALLILDGQTAVKGAAQGVELALRTLVPSLFPFLFLSILLTSSYLGGDHPLLRPIGRIFHVPNGGETLLITAFLGGYPAGAQSVAEAWHSGQITKEQGEKLLAFCSNAGPSFLFGMTAAFFPEGWMVWVLWLFHILGAMAAAQVFLCPTDNYRTQKATRNMTVTDALLRSIRVMAVICGWVILFRVLIAFLDRWFLWLLPATAQTCVIGILELSNGICQLAQIEDVRFRFLVCSGILSLGGLCVAMQTSSVTTGLRQRYYYWGKLIQCTVSIALSAALFYEEFRFLPLILLISFGIWKKAVAFPRPMVYNEANQ